MEANTKPTAEIAEGKYVEIPFSEFSEKEALRQFTLLNLRELILAQREKTGQAPKRAQVSRKRFKEIASLFPQEKLYVVDQKAIDAAHGPGSIPGLMFDGCFIEAVEDLPESGPVFIEEVGKYRVVQAPLDVEAHEMLASLRSRLRMTNAEVITLALKSLRVEG
jgi:hypothetical protein